MLKFNPRKTKHLRALNQILAFFFNEKKSKTHPDIKSARDILLIDFTLLGDIVMLTSFLRILKKNNPIAKITLVCGSWAQAILNGQSLVDDFIIVNTKALNSPKEFMVNLPYIKKLITKINMKQYDYALEPRGDLRHIFFMHFCNAQRKISYNYTGGECLLTDTIVPDPDVKHLVDDKLYFARQIGCQFTENDIYPRLEMTATQKSDATVFYANENLSDKYIIGIHPGASMKIKCWQGFADLIIHLNEIYPNIAFVIFKGPGEEDVVNSVLKIVSPYGVNLHVSESSIEKYIGRIAACNILVCNDSGAGHIAAALGVPVFVIFGHVEPELAKPYSKVNVFTFSKELECKPCFNTVCTRNLECIKAVTVEEVFESVNAFLQENVKATD